MTTCVIIPGTTASSTRTVDTHQLCLSCALLQHTYAWEIAFHCAQHGSYSLLLSEGYEHDVIPAWRPEDNLPDEVSMEIHADYVGSNPPNTTGELGLTFWHLANLGYAAYSQEINSIVPGCCAEFTFRRLGYHSG